MSGKVETVDIVLPLVISEDQNQWKTSIAKRLKVSIDDIHEMRLIKHSIDARQKKIKISLRIEVGIRQALPKQEDLPQFKLKPLTKNSRTILIIGFGPAGMFAALEAIELGYKPIILERGKNVFDRRIDLPKATRKGYIEEDSNYSFGEGGAGTFSDGKLYTRATKRGPVKKVYDILVAHGAPPRILTDAHPHVGSNLLPKVVMRIRESIINAGGEIYFSQKVNDFIIQNEKVIGARTQQGQEFICDATILCTGHSARDIYELLQQKKIIIENKPFAIGVRIEHPQALIDSIQYHYPRGDVRPEMLPAARYTLSSQVEGRGVHSFCMCPGGFIVPAATQNDEVVVNGMSLSKRNSPFANSGIVVNVEVEDTLNAQQEHGVLAGVLFQKQIEQIAKKAGGNGQVAPGQRLTDFLSGKLSTSLPKTSYVPGVQTARIDQLLPQWIVKPMKTSFKYFEKNMPGYITEEALLLGFETRTSSPVRIPRHKETLEHLQLKNLYPCGEGAGYAGGIASAAIDGMRCAKSAILNQQNK
ncbi:MAG TPA: FAD-binding protein [Oligoflexia bacterium]|nr:FAD-binding protein [Oligoflexia bacterium]HMR24290.1 FAD-binding protein [Oligoflexia bacterium]